MKSLFPILMFLFVMQLFSCTNDNDEKLITYSTVIDSTFYCNAEINGTSILFPYQKWEGLPINGVTQRFQLLKDDSITYSYTLIYFTGLTHSESDKIYIEFNKKFRVEDLSDIKKNEDDSTYRLGILSAEEFQSIFDSTNLKYSYYGPNYKSILDGVSIIYATNNGIWYSTAIDSDTVKYYNAASNIKILKISKMKPTKLIIEGQFDLLVFNWLFSTQGTIKKGYFKGYIEK